MTHIKNPKSYRCENCWKKYEYCTDDFESIEEHGVCVDCGKIKFKD